MPGLSPKQPCKAPRCPALVKTGYCAQHQDQSYDVRRGGSVARGYGYTWRKFRKAFLSDPANVICADCQREPSTDVHHIKKVRDYPELKYSVENCMGLCASCHSKRTNRGE